MRGEEAWLWMPSVCARTETGGLAHTQAVLQPTAKLPTSILTPTHPTYPVLPPAVVLLPPGGGVVREVRLAVVAKVPRHGCTAVRVCGVHA